MTHTFEHRGVRFELVPDQEEGYFAFCFNFEGMEVRGQRQTRLLELAARKVTQLIDRHFREAGATSNSRHRKTA